MGLISISGAASTGKSTLLNKLENNKNYKVDQFKVARHVLAKMDLPLTEIVKSYGLLIAFQEQILEEKIKNDASLLLNSESITFVERCPADFFAFVKNWEPRINKSEFSKWSEDYLTRCVDAMKYYSSCVLIPSGVFAHVDDGIRASADTQNATQYWLTEFLFNFAKNNIKSFQLHVLKSHDIINRVKEIDLHSELTLYGTAK